MIRIRTFTGEIPRTASVLLPDNAAVLADNCQFSRGTLWPLPDHVAFRDMSGQASGSVKGLWTENGLTFFTWPNEARAVRGPVQDDQFQRVYFTTNNGFRVTQRSLAEINGGEPFSYRVGVPAPVAAPDVVVAERAALPDNITLEWKFFYESAGVKYQEQTITPTQVMLGREYTFTAPEMTREETDTITTTTTTSTAPITNTTSTNTTNTVSPTGKPTNPETTPQATTQNSTTTVATTPGTVSTTSTSRKSGVDPATGIADALKKTPADAIPCVELIGKSSTGAKVFDVFSSNSAFDKDSDNENANGLTIQVTSKDAGLVSITLKYGEGFLQTRAFVFTYVNVWNEESAPSKPVSCDHDFLQTPKLTIPTVAASDMVPITRVRVYGTVTTNAGTADFQLVGEATFNNVSSQVFTVSTAVATWGRVVDTTGHLPPPSGLFNVVSMPNGILALLKGDEVWFCESYKPWAFNPENVTKLQFGAVGAVVSGNALVVTTTGKPYLISGALPSQMYDQQIDAVQAGVSAKSIVDCGGFVIYASRDGLVMVQGTTASLMMGQKFFARKEWQTRYGNALNQMTLAYHDGALIGFTEANGGFVIRFDEAEGSYTRCTTLNGLAGFMLPMTDSLYFSVGKTLFQYAGAETFQQFTWTSKEFTFPQPVNLGALQVLGNGSVAVTVIADEIALPTITFATGRGTARLPAGFKARRYQVKLVGSGSVQEVIIAPTMGALARA